MGWERARQGQETQDELGLAASGRIPVAGVGDIDAGYCLRFLRHIRDCSFATVDAEQKALVDRMSRKGARAAAHAPPSARKAASRTPKTGRSGSTGGRACAAGCAKRRARAARYGG